MVYVSVVFSVYSGAANFEVPVKHVNIAKRYYRHLKKMFTVTIFLPRFLLNFIDSSGVLETISYIIYVLYVIVMIIIFIDRNNNDDSGGKKEEEQRIPSKHQFDIPALSKI